MYNPVPLRPSEVDVDIPVRWEDQKQINEFGGLNTKRTEQRAKLDVLKKQLTDLEDADLALMEADGGDDDDRILVAVGECFIAESSDAASEFVTAELDRVRGEMEEVDAAVTAIDERMALLKKSLYGRFGKAIHLENDDDE